MNLISILKNPCLRAVECVSFSPLSDSRNKMRAHSFESLSRFVQQRYLPPDGVNGPTNAHSRLRLFNQQEKTVRVTLFRDHHAWCPYCQKVWLWLEEKQIPYKIDKVTMFCYGQKEAWYKSVAPNGMLPAVKIDNRVITESDDILAALEAEFGPLGVSMHSKAAIEGRKMERNLFRAWCAWLCRENGQEEYFFDECEALSKFISKTPGPFLLDKFTVCDTVLTPYIERMQSSILYYKAFNVRKNFPILNQWFCAMEERQTYRGTKSDHHTHAHDLPPQMGGCYEGPNVGEWGNEEVIQEAIDAPVWNKWADSLEVSYPEPKDAILEAAYRLLRHYETVIKINPYDNEDVAMAIRFCLTILLHEGPKSEEGTEEIHFKNRLNAAASLLYIRDRISVPRDMTLWAGRRLRCALKEAAEIISEGKKIPLQHAIPVNHRRDTNPAPFVNH